MRKRYVDTSHGQVHLREAGDAAGKPLLLVHWTPLSGRMFAGIAPYCVAAGYRVIAPDLLGYGRSDARPTEWSVAAWADNLAEVLDALAVEAAAVVGGHNGASVALELALGHPARVSAVVLDGCPVLSDELRAAFRGMVSAPVPQTPQVAIDRSVGLLAEYIPGYLAEGAELSLLWPAMIDYLETDFVSSAAVAGLYDITRRLPLLRHPALLLGAERDPLAGTFDQAMACLRPEQHHMFPGHHPLHFAERQAEYAQIVLGFFRS